MIQSVSRAFAILEVLTEDAEKPMPLSEVARKVRLHLSTCANLLKTLRDLGYVEQARKKGAYTLGPMTYCMARNGPYRRDLVKAAEPHMERLAREVRETALLATMDRGRRNILCQVDGNEVFQIREQYLLRQDVYRTATGRLLLAHLAADELRSFLAGNGLPAKAQWPEANSERKLATALRQIRTEGQAVTLADLVGVAFPIRQNGRVVAALGLFLPLERFKGEHRDRTMHRMAQTAAAISTELRERPHGYHRQNPG